MFLKAGHRRFQSRQYQSELYLHAGCKKTQCKHVSGSVKVDSQYDVSPASLFSSCSAISFRRLVHNSASQLKRGSPSNNHV